MINEDGIVIGEITRPDAELTVRLSTHTPATISNPGSLGASAALAPGAIAPLAPGMRLLGPVVTVQLDHVEHLTPLTAATIAEPGDVLLIAAGGGVEVGTWGHGLCLAAEASGVAGVVVDGAVVNKAELLEMGMPTFSRGASSVTGGWDGGGQINVPVTIGGVVVHPGDILIGDADGVVVVPAHKLRATVELAERQEAEVERRRGLLSAGTPLLEVVRASRAAS